MESLIIEVKTPWPLVNVEEDNGELVVSFHEDAFQWPSVEEVAAILLTLVDETEGGPLVLNFGTVGYLTGVGLEKLVLVNKKLTSQGRRLHIRNVDPELMSVFALTGLTKEF